MPQDRIKEFIARLKPAQLELLIDMARAMTIDIRENINPSSDIVSLDFAVNFSNRLLIHHGTHVEKFNKKAFEYAFWKASVAAGRNAVLVGNSLSLGADVIVDNVKFSLKTEAERKLNKNAVKISKLMEARALRECRTGHDFVNFTLQRILVHLHKYERILSLRAWDLNPTCIQYDLIEIPKEVLLSVQTVRASDFSQRTANGSSAAAITFKGRRAFTLRLDGSVEKVTVSGLPVELCTHHASWAIPISSVASSSSDE